MLRVAARLCGELAALGDLEVAQRRAERRAVQAVYVLALNVEEAEVIVRVNAAAARRLLKLLEGRRAGDPPELVSANKRILETLDWHPQYQEIDQIVGDALAWERKLAERAG